MLGTMLPRGHLQKQPEPAWKDMVCVVMGLAVRLSMLPCLTPQPGPPGMLTCKHGSTALV